MKEECREVMKLTQGHAERKGHSGIRTLDYLTPNSLPFYGTSCLPEGKGMESELLALQEAQKPMLRPGSG